MENVATYSEARSEYTKQLATLIVPSLIVWFQKVWSLNSSNKQQCMALFQTDCEEIARWNQDRIQDEVRALIERSGCDYMEELMTAVFIAHTKVLTAVRLSQKQKKLSITVPKLDHFIHRVFKEVARSFWKTPYLFMDSVGVMERQKNILQAEALATEAISTAVRGMLPVKQILKDYMEDTDDVEETEAEPEVVPAPHVTEAPLPKEEAAPVVEKPEEAAAAPPVVNIETEPSVRFSEYDTVFDETQGAPEMRYNPKEGDEDEDDGPSDGALAINEESTTPLTDDDAEDLEAPKKPVAQAPAPAPVSDKIDDSEIVILE